MEKVYIEHINHTYIVRYVKRNKYQRYFVAQFDDRVVSYDHVVEWLKGNGYILV